MPPVERVGRLQAATSPGEYERTVAAIPELAARLEGAERETKVRHTTSTTSYFRRSSGPGWALPGDAGHFKDPVTAQGIRDALRFGRLLGEAAAPALDDPRALDRALAAWERSATASASRSTSGRTGRPGEAMNPIEVELYRPAEGDRALGTTMLDVFSRTARPAKLLTARRFARLMVRSLRRRDGRRREALRVCAREFRGLVSDAGERARLRRRGFVVARPAP